MQNLSLEKKTPTLCWHWDLHVTNNLCTAKRVNAAEPKTENLKEPRAALAYGNVPFALGQCHGAKSLSTQMSFTSCPVSQLYNRLLRMITVACVVSSPKCLWVECKSMQCFKCGKYFILTEYMITCSMSLNLQHSITNPNFLLILVDILLLTKNKNTTLLNTLSMACNNASLFLGIVPSEQHFSPFNLHQSLKGVAEDKTSWDRRSWKNSQQIFCLHLNSRGFSPAISSGSCVLCC